MKAFTVLSHEVITRLLKAETVESEALLSTALDSMSPHKCEHRLYAFNTFNEEESHCLGGYQLTEQLETAALVMGQWGGKKAEEFLKQKVCSPSPCTWLTQMAPLSLFNLSNLSPAWIQLQGEGSEGVMSTSGEEVYMFAANKWVPALHVNQAIISNGRIQISMLLELIFSHLSSAQLREMQEPAPSSRET